MESILDASWTSPDSLVSLYIGDCRESMRAMPAGVVQTCVTSPPYYSLRDYGVDGQIGLERTPEEFIAQLVDVFREVRRVLRDDGTLWVNLGDSYADDTKWGGSSGGKNYTSAAGGYQGQRVRRGADLDPKPRTDRGQLRNMPHRVAEALRADGWIWRQTIVWSKPSAMPESVSGWCWKRCRVKVAPANKEGQSYSTAHPGNPRTTHSGSEFHTAKWAPCPGCPKCEANGGYVLKQGKGRCTTAHEYIFLFSKCPLYFWDGEAVKEPVSGNAHSRGHGLNPKAAAITRTGGVSANASHAVAITDLVENRNPRSVWTLGPEPFKGAHFACFPSSLPKRCIEASTSAAGCCPACGSCWAPIVESDRLATRPGSDSKVYGASGLDPGNPHERHNGSIVGNRDPQRHIAVTRVLGYRPTCGCPAADPVPCLVHDPFGGSGQTGRVARALGRRATLCELSPEYSELAKVRVMEPLKALKVKGRRRRRLQQMTMFPEDA